MQDVPLKPETETIDEFLGGAIKLIQPKDGYRVSMDTVLLAAAVPAKTGDKVIEGGVGTGGAALCLAYRVPGISVYGIDLQDRMLEAARRNIEYNELSDRVTVAHGSVTEPEGKAGTYDHAMINPPYLEAGKAIRPPDVNKGHAHMDEHATLKDWVNFCLFHLRHKGTLTIVYRADRLDELIARLHRRVGDLRIFPLWPRDGVAAKRVLVQGRKGTFGQLNLLPGMALHGSVERYTEDAKRILWDGEALPLNSFVSAKESR